MAWAEAWSEHRAGFGFVPPVTGDGREGTHLARLVVHHHLSQAAAGDKHHQQCRGRAQEEYKAQTVEVPAAEHDAVGERGVGSVRHRASQQGRDVHDAVE